MDGEGRARFPVVDRYVGERMGIDLSCLEPGERAVIATPLRLRRELSYGYVRALWWSWLADDRIAVSVPPGAKAAVEGIASDVCDVTGLFEPSLAEQLKAPVNAALAEQGLGPVDRVIEDLQFACNGHCLQRRHCGECRAITDESVPPAEGLAIPTHCLPDGIVRAVIVSGRAVSVAWAHRTGVMEGQVVDLAIDTAPGHRRRGYARTAVSAVVEHATSQGGEAIYACSPGNAASIATARSVGFVPYARTLILSAPATDLAG